MWHSFIIMLNDKLGRLTRSMVNKRLKQGATRILKLIGASYTITFAPEFQYFFLARKKSVPYILMANHLSLFDLPLLFATLPGTMRFLVKQSLFKMPLFGSAIRAAEFLPVHIEDPKKMQELLQTAKNKMQEGMMIFIFPEGRRSLTGQLLPFKPGGFRLAQEIGAHIVPMKITGTDKALPARTFALRRGQKLTVHVGKPIDT